MWSGQAFHNNIIHFTCAINNNDKCSCNNYHYPGVNNFINNKGQCYINTNNHNSRKHQHHHNSKDYYHNFIFNYNNC